jgi:hypothetical protein
MKNITRLALAFAVAVIACLSPMAHAEDEASLVGSGIKSVRYYEYGDESGLGTMVVKDGPTNPNGKSIYVTIYYKGHVFSGKGWRTLASEETYWVAQCEFWVYGSGISAKFTGYLPVKPVGFGGGDYFYNGSGTAYPWGCELH